MLPVLPTQTPHAEVPEDVRRHYLALQTWLQTVTGLAPRDIQPLLAAHQRWLLAELLRPEQPRRERLPVAVEASARWQKNRLETRRFIVGATLSALQTDVGAALTRYAEALRIPGHVRRRWPNDVAPHGVQFGLARGEGDRSRRVYLEGGNLQVPMHAWEWQRNRVRDRTYTRHEPNHLDVLGAVPSRVADAWRALVAVAPQRPALLRADRDGHARAVHVAMARRPVLEHRQALLNLAAALDVSLVAARAWLDQLPSDTALSVVALGVDRGLQLTVYVAPDQDCLPQPGPPAGDLRRTPGTLCWSLQSLDRQQWHGWLLFSLPGTPVPARPAARSEHVHVWTGSAVPDALALAQLLAEAVDSDAAALGDRIAAAEPALRAVLAAAGLRRAPA